MLNEQRAEGPAANLAPLRDEPKLSFEFNVNASLRKEASVHEHINIGEKGFVAVDEFDAKEIKAEMKSRENI